MALPPLDQLVRPRDLPEVRPADDLPRWAAYIRDELLRLDVKYFDGAAIPWIEIANSHELVELEEEVLDLPESVLREAIRMTGDF